MTTNLDVVERWFNVQMGTHDGPLRNSQSCSLGATLDYLYSWGQHFRLAEPVGFDVDVPDRRLWLLNGQRFSSSTSRHQTHVRDAAARTELPFVVLPFSALERADIVRSTIRLLDKQEEQVVKVRRTASRWEDVPEHQRWQFRALGEYQKDLDHYEWDHYEHLLGECVFAADVLSRDKLGRDVLRKDVVFLSAFDHQESYGRHYFLCELPVAAYRETTLAEAWEMLKPPEVKKAEELGVDVVRQGDIFAIATPNTVTDRKMAEGGASVTPRARLFDQRHSATRVAECEGSWPGPLVRGCLYHDGGEHKRQKLGDGKTWYRVFQNTVPHDALNLGRRAWSIHSANLSVD